MKLSRLVLLAALCAFSAVNASAAGLCVAVISYNSTASEEEMAQAVAKLNVAKLGDSNTVSSRQKILDGGDILFFTRVPASTGRQVTRLGVQKADLEYSVKGGTITAQVEIATGTKIPSGQVGSYSNSGSAPARSGQAVLLDHKSRETENTMRSHGNQRTTRGKSMRILVAEIVP